MVGKNAGQRILLVVCFAGSGRVDGRDFAECQDRGPPCLWGVRRGCVQGSLWADRGGRSGEGLVGPLALQRSLRPVPDVGPRSPWEAAGTSSFIPYSSATAEATGKAWLLCWPRLLDETPAAYPPEEQNSLGRTARCLERCRPGVEGSEAGLLCFSNGHGYR